MAVKIGINGFGRIGRMVLRIAAERPETIEVCGINLRKADLDYMVYLMKYDSVFGRFPGTIEEGENCLIINGKQVAVFGESDVTKIPWASCGAEYIVESTGQFNTTELASGHLAGGAKKVVLSAPAKDKETPTYVIGVNHETYDPKYNVVSNASCTTNCLAPLAKIIDDHFGIEQGLMSTIHSATSKQKPVDNRAGRDYRTGRSVFNNIIPSTTGAAKAVGLVMPHLRGRLTGMSFRVPTNDVSVVDLTARLRTPTTYEDICKAVEEASRTYMKGIVTYTKDEVVSTDMRGETHTCIFDENAGIMLDDNFVKLIAWYDNEWGYSCKVLDLIEHMAKVDAE
ncbi:MAG: type I glyceraldehyde-3-phosphate dehydrogenase [Clostridiales bacterium]|nr:type I glyceraldehyde-3-phosphate dehydrogenase [Clostridiales bacterium]